jgi:hypothetical protein
VLQLADGVWAREMLSSSVIERSLVCDLLGHGAKALASVGDNYQLH